VVCGDLNLATTNWSCQNSTDEFEASFLNSIDHHNYKQLVDFSITHSGSSLDVVLCKNTDHIVNVVTDLLLDKALMQDRIVFSDHTPIVITLDKGSTTSRKL